MSVILPLPSKIHGDRCSLNPWELRKSYNPNPDSRDKQTYRRHEYWPVTSLSDTANSRENRDKTVCLFSVQLHWQKWQKVSPIKSASIGPITKWCIHEICIIHRSFTSLSSIYDIFKIDWAALKQTVKIAGNRCFFTTILSILKIW